MKLSAAARVAGVLGITVDELVYGNDVADKWNERSIWYNVMVVRGKDG